MVGVGKEGGRVSDQLGGVLSSLNSGGKGRDVVTARGAVIRGICKNTAVSLGRVSGCEF